MGLLRRIGWLLVVVLLVGGCLTCGSPPPPVPPPHAECRRTIQYWIDPEFTMEENLSIVQAVYAWQEGSERAVCFILGNGGLHIRKAVDPVKVREIELQGARSNGTPPESVVGLAQHPDAWILSDKIHSDQDFYATSVHEIGHLLGLPHYEPWNSSSIGQARTAPEPSWMYPSIDRAPHDSRSITSRDRAALFASEAARR